MAVGTKGPIEVFIEEHGTIYVACGLERREEVEELINSFGLQQISDAYRQLTEGQTPVLAPPAAADS